MLQKVFINCAKIFEFIFNFVFNVLIHIRIRIRILFLLLFALFDTFIHFWYIFCPTLLLSRYYQFSVRILKGRVLTHFFIIIKLVKCINPVNKLINIMPLVCILNLKNIKLLPTNFID